MKSIWKKDLEKREQIRVILTEFQEFHYSLLAKLEPCCFSEISLKLRITYAKDSKELMDHLVTGQKV